MDWIDKINKELEEIREASREANDKISRGRSGVTKQRMAAWKAADPEGFIEHQKKAFQGVLEKNPNHQSYAGKIGGPLGYAAMFANLVELLGSEEAANEYIKERASTMYENTSDEWKAEFHSKGGTTTQEKYGAGFHLKEYAKKDPDQIKRAQASSLRNRLIKKESEKDVLHDALPEGWFTLQELNVNELPCSKKQLGRWIQDISRYDKDIATLPARYKKHHGNPLNLPQYGAYSDEIKQYRVERLLEILPESFTQYEAFDIAKENNIPPSAARTIIKDRTLTSVHRPKNIDKTKSKTILAKIYTKKSAK